MSNYLLITKIETRIPERVNTCLNGSTTRGMGNLVNVGYYYSILANSLAAKSADAPSSSFDTGVEFGSKLAPVIKAFYHDDQLEIIKKYYAQLHHIDIKMIEIGESVEITMAECAEAATILKSKELLSFLFGELEGLVSQFLARNMKYQESAFEYDTVRIKLVSKA
jgi:hypothetical protein